MLTMTDLIRAGFRPWFANNKGEHYPPTIWAVTPGKYAYALVAPGRRLHPAGAFLRTNECDTWQEAEAELLAMVDAECNGDLKLLATKARTGQLRVDWDGTGVMADVAQQRAADEALASRKGSRKATR